MEQGIGLEEDTAPTEVAQASPAKPPSKRGKRGPGKLAGTKAAPTSEKLWIRIAPDIKQRLKTRAEMEGMHVSQLIEQMLLAHEFREHDDFAWEKAISRIEKAVAQLTQAQRLCMEILLWFLRAQLANMPPVPDGQRELWAEQGKSRWNRFLKDMAGDTASELFQALQRELKRGQGR